MERKRLDIDPEMELAAEAEEGDDTETLVKITLEAPPEEEPAADEVATGIAAIQRFAKLAPSSPGVYRMLDAKGTVLYVGKAKNITKRVGAYTRSHGHTNRIARMIAATTTMEFVSTTTEMERRAFGIRNSRNAKARDRTWAIRPVNDRVAQLQSRWNSPVR